jgi:SAM-dependent methyltransferase
MDVRAFAAFVYRIPIMGKVAKFVWQRVIHPFPGSTAYWAQRYSSGDTSGSGSYGRLAEFKAEVLNSFVKEHSIHSVFEFGCGDGNQLSLAEYPEYCGLDVSSDAIQICKDRFRDDKSKRFIHIGPLTSIGDKDEFTAELAMSLDVVFHLVEDDVFHAYMTNLFVSAEKYVIVFSSDEEKPASYHERHRKWSDWVRENCPDWELRKRIPNKFPFDERDPENTSPADFFIFGKSSGQN